MTGVIVIGGGPAGSATALFLARAGHRVLLLDQATFPRDKVCGEFISPAADSILEDLGVLSDIETLSPVRLRGVAISSYEQGGFAVDYPSLRGVKEPVTSLSLKRYVLDRLMIRKVAAAGVEVREGHKVSDFVMEEGRVAGVLGRNAERRAFEYRASLVVDCGGRNSVSLRRFDLKKKNPGSGKIALAAHWTVAKPLKKYCYMHISHPGYTGIAPTGENQVNVVLVVDANCLKGKDAQDFYVRTVLQNPLRRSLLDQGRMEEKARSVDSLGFSVRPLKIGGLLLVGDASGFIDPFTGEGIYLSLRSAEIAADVIDSAIRRKDFGRASLSVYDRRRHREFSKKFVLSKILQRLIYHPSWCNRVMRILAANPELAATLVGVIGDYIPAEKVVSGGFLWQLLRRAGSASANPPPIREGDAPSCL